MENKQNKKARIGLWTKPSGNLLSHGKGLTESDIKFLQSLKVGDRLIIWDNTERNASTSYPTHSMCLYEDTRTEIKKDKEDAKTSGAKSSKSILD